MTARKSGRPYVLRDYTEAQRDQLLRLVADGMTKSAACAVLGIPKQTVATWIAQDDDWAGRWRRARIEQVHSMADEIVSIADEPITSMEEAQRAKLRVEARKWVMSKWAPRLYGEKLREDHTQRQAVILLPAVDGATGLKQITATSATARIIEKGNGTISTISSHDTGGRG